MELIILGYRSFPRNYNQEGIERHDLTLHNAYI